MSVNDDHKYSTLKSTTFVIEIKPKINLGLHVRLGFGTRLCHVPANYWLKFTIMKDLSLSITALALISLCPCLKIPNALYLSLFLSFIFIFIFKKINSF